MTSRCVNPNRPLRHVLLAGATVALLMTPAHDAAARNGSSERSVEAIESRSAGEPIMAIVSLRNQRITIYDANG